MELKEESSGNPSGEDSCNAFGHVQEAVIRGCTVRAIVVANDRGEKREHAAPDEIKSDQRDGKRGPRSTAHQQDGDQAGGLKHVGNKHGHLTADAVREPAPEDAAGAVGEASEREGGGDGAGADLEEVSDNGGLNGDHGTAGIDHHKTHEKQIEMWCLQHLETVELLRVAAHAGRYRLLGRRGNVEVRTGIVKKLGGYHNEDALSDARIDERLVIVGAGDDQVDQRDKKSGASPESRSNETGDRTALIGKPFQGGGDRAAIDKGRAYTSH